MSHVTTELRDWVKAVVAQAPPEVRLIYIEWNDARKGARKAVAFHAFGYPLKDFDPEDSESLDALADYTWEAAKPFYAGPTIADDDEALQQKLSDVFRKTKSVLAPLLKRGGRIAFGRHESSVAVFPPIASRGSEYYYELHEASRSNHYTTLGLDHLQNESILQVINHQKFSRAYPREGTFHLQPRGKLRDVLYGPQWMICSDRMRALIQASTKKCQVYPIRLYTSPKVDPSKEVPGYFAVNLYEQLSCLDPKDVLPCEDEGDFPDFHPARGYRILKAKVGDRDIFRIAYENRRLLVSAAFRAKCEELGITGVEWLRREAI